MENENKKIEAIANGKMVSKKSPFFSGDIGKISSYIVNDVVLPKLKELIYSVGSNGLDMLLNGDAVHSKKKQPGYQMPSYMNYWRNNMSNIPEPSSQSMLNMPRQRTSSNVYAYEDVIIEPLQGETLFDARKKAEDIIRKMQDCIDEYKSVNVATFYTYVGLPSTPVDSMFGWYDLSTAYPERYFDSNTEGYIIRFPKATKLD